MPCGELGGALVSLPEEWSSRRLLHPLPEGKGRQVSVWGTSAGTVWAQWSMWQMTKGTERLLTCLRSTEPGCGTCWSSPAVCQAEELGRGRQPWSLEGLMLVPPGLF